MSIELLSEWKKLTGDLSKLEAAVAALKDRRSAISQHLLGVHGKGHVYDVDGIPMIVSLTKVGTHFLTPRAKAPGSRQKKEGSEDSSKTESKAKGKRGRPKGSTKAAKAEALAFQAALEAAKHPPVAVLDQNLVPAVTAPAVQEEEKIAPAAVSEAVSAVGPKNDPIPPVSDEAKKEVSKPAAVEEDDPLLAALAEAAAASE